jgi:hypothetical protein
MRVRSVNAGSAWPSQAAITAAGTPWRCMSVPQLPAFGSFEDLNQGVGEEKRPFAAFRLGFGQM